MKKGDKLKVFLLILINFDIFFLWAEIDNILTHHCVILEISSENHLSNPNWLLWDIPDDFLLYVQKLF